MVGKTILVSLGKLLLGGITFIIGSIIGSMVASLLGLQQPSMPEGVDSATAFLLLSLESPLMMLALAFIARGLGGGLLLRALTLSFFTWVAYSLNTAIESLAFTTTTAKGALFATGSFLVPSLLCGLVVALLFPSGEQPESLGTLAKRFFGRWTAGAWMWRIGLAAVIFVPIYIFFGSIVAPLTADYFQQSMYGVRQPSQSEMILVLMVRSVLFLAASLPIVVLWQRSNRELVLSLGFALFVLVGLLYMLGAYYMPLEIRVPHSLEILAGSFVHAGMLVMLLAGGKKPTAQALRARVVS
jgi:hypothetical protein